MKKKNFWYRKNVLITGITGFVGSNLAKNLIENKANITGIGKSQKVESSEAIFHFNREISSLALNL